MQYLFILIIYRFPPMFFQFFWQCPGSVRFEIFFNVERSNTCPIIFWNSFTFEKKKINYINWKKKWPDIKILYSTSWNKQWWLEKSLSILNKHCIITFFKMKVEQSLSTEVNFKQAMTNSNPPPDTNACFALTNVSIERQNRPEFLPVITAIHSILITNYQFKNDCRPKWKFDSWNEEVSIQTHEWTLYLILKSEANFTNLKWKNDFLMFKKRTKQIFRVQKYEFYS